MFPAVTLSNKNVSYSGSKPAPGEISLAHRGVLFLDELPEFPTRVLEVLRQPMESGEVSISRAAFKASFPARFQLIAAMNPCPCGYQGEARCRCTPDRVAQYQGRISGPLLDRIDMHLRLQRSRQEVNFANSSAGATSAEIRQRVEASRARQQRRQNCLNAEIDSKQIQMGLSAQPELADLAQQAIDRMDLSMRAIHRAYRVALTIADLAGTPMAREHLLEALNYRQAQP